MTVHRRIRRTSPLVVWPMCVFFLVVLYLASLGPVAGLATHERISDETYDVLFGTVYFPISWLERRTYFFEDYAIGRAYVWYVDLWMPDFDDPWVANPI